MDFLKINYSENNVGGKGKNKELILFEVINL